MIVDPLTCFSYWLLIYLIYEEKLAENFSCQAATPFTRLSARCWMLDTTIIHCQARSLNRGQICWGSDVPSSFSLYISPKYCHDRCIAILGAKYCSCIYYMRRRDGVTGAEGGWEDRCLGLPDVVVCQRRRQPESVWQTFSAALTGTW